MHAFFSQRRGRRVLLKAGLAFTALAALGACGQEPETIIATPPPARPPDQPTATPAVTPTQAAPTAVPTASAAPVLPTTVLPAPSPPLAPPKPRATVAPAPPTTGRPQYQGDAQHTGRSPHLGPTSQPALLRTFDTTNPGVDLPDPGWTNPDIQCSCAIGPDGTIYVGNYLGNVFALRDGAAADKLELAWRFHPPGGTSWHATPALSPDGILYVGFSTGGNGPDARGTFYALRAPDKGVDAKVVWTADLGPGRTTSSPTIAPDGAVYALAGQGRLFAFAPDGRTLWSAQTGPTLKSAPALGPEGQVYVASMDGNLYSVSPPRDGSKEGRVVWKFDFGKNLGSKPLVVAKPPPAGADGVGTGASPTVAPDGMVYVGANNSNFYAVDPDGKMAWLFEAEREIAGIWSTAALGEDGKTLYFTANKGGVYAVNREDGALRWQFPVYGSIYSSPTLDKRGTLYTASNVGHVFGIDSHGAQKLFDWFGGGPPIWTAPAVRPDGTLVVGDRTGRVMVLG